MIVSNKQIMRLIRVAQLFLSLILEHKDSPEYKAVYVDINQLIIDITNQQSEELKVIE